MPPLPDRRHVVVGCVLTVLGSLSVACSSPPEEEPVDVTLIGDSLVEWGDWEGLTSGNVGTHGVAGETTGQIAARAGHVLTGEEDAVVLWAGTNDIGQGLPLEQTRVDLVELLTTVGSAAPEAEIVVLAVPPLAFAQPEVDALNTVIHEEVTRVGADFVDPAAVLGQPGARSADGVHIEPSGYESLLELLRRHLP